MPKSIQRIVIAGDAENRLFEETAQAILRFLAHRHVQAASFGWARPPAPTLDPQTPPEGFARLAQASDLIIVLGGDGTFLRMATASAAWQVPLLGINLGRLGFLSDISPDDLMNSLEEILDGHGRLEQRMLLSGRIAHGREERLLRLALNEVCLLKAEPGRIIECSLAIDQQWISQHRADGMLCATPTGSTAYALSSGGPVLHPDVPAMVVVPICPHTLSDRPLVLPAGATVAFHVKPGGAALVMWDGHHQHQLMPGEFVEITASPHRLPLLHPRGYNYFQLLRHKLLWGSPPQHSTPTSSPPS
jgi:NAD+ kinase